MNIFAQFWVSVVLIDSTSTNMSDDVEAANRATGAILIYGVPYRNFNSIENYYFIYKRHLKLNNEKMDTDWRSVHIEALNVIIVRHLIVSILPVNDLHS